MVDRWIGNQYQTALQHYLLKLQVDRKVMFLVMVDRNPYKHCITSG